MNLNEGIPNLVHKDYQGADQKDKQNHHFPSRKLFAGKSNFSDSESKRKYNLSLFKEVAPKYQYATIALSFGQDRHWKKLLIDQTPTEKQLVIVDIATGTGDIAQLLKKKYTQSLVLGVDQSIDMMHYQKNRNTQEKMYVSAQDMNVLALKKESVDLVTGGYALRNAPDISTTLDEIHRILKPGGYAAFLDFSRLSSRVWWAIEYRLLKFWGIIWGFLLHRDPSVYAYIAESLSRFPDEKEIVKLFGVKGFELHKSIRLFGGFLNISIVKKC